jgi:hypothetical protein
MINYEEEVRKVYPYAYGQYMMGLYLIVDGVDEEYEGGETIGEIAHSQEDSWKSAYDNMVLQGKILSNDTNKEG